MKALIITLGTIIFLVACNKPKIESIKTNNSSDSLSYQPKIPGSKWTYRRTIGGFQNATYNIIRLSTDTVAYGSSFQIFGSDDNTTNNANQYFRQDGDKYYNILTASTNKPQILFLDASKNVNESWLGGVNGSDTYTFTMKQKISSYVLDNFTFKNVLVVHLERTGPNPVSADTYYAQGVGQVKSDGTVTGGGISTTVNVKVITVDLK